MLLFLKYVLYMKEFMYTALFFMTIFTLLALTVTKNRKLNSPMVRFICIFSNRTKAEYFRISLHIIRFFLFVSCVAVRLQSIEAFVFSAVLISVLIYLLHLDLGFILPDALYAILAANAVIIKNFLLSYVSEVTLDAKVIAVAVLLAVFILLISVCMLIRGVSADLKKCGQDADRGHKRA